MATTRIRRSHKTIGGGRIVSYYKPTEYLLVNIIEWILIIMIMPFYYVCYGMYWIAKKIILLIIKLIKKGLNKEEHN